MTILFQKEGVNEKLTQLQSYPNFQIGVLSDFDDTLTKAFLEDGKTRGANSFSVFPNNPQLLGSDYVKKTNELFEKYYALEQDSHLEQKKKTKYMKEWWEKEFELYRTYGLTKETFNFIIANHLMDLKEGIKYFLTLLYEKEISTLIFSAGIHQLIHGFFQKEKIDFSNIHVIANQFEFDERGKFVGTLGECIHSQNKQLDKFNQIKEVQHILGKKALVILGDSLSDLDMIDEERYEVVLKIGFLNRLEGHRKYESQLEEFSKNFDIVFEGRSDFKEINKLVKKVLEK